jgi:hypothetical protein
MSTPVRDRLIETLQRWPVAGGLFPARTLPSPGDTSCVVAPTAPRWRAVPFIAGAALIIAGLLKTYQLWAEPSFGSLMTWSRRFEIGLVEAQLALGFALIANLWAPTLRPVALLLFVAFIGAALSKVVSGARSCGCLGSVEIRPWVILLGDLAVILGLAIWRPPSCSGRSKLRTSLPLILLFICPWPILVAVRAPAFPRLRSDPIVTLSQVMPGERRFLLLSLKNPYAEPVEVVSVKSSCLCLTGEALPWRFEAQRETSVALVLDIICLASRPSPAF